MARYIDADLMLDDMKAELEKASEELLTEDEAKVIMTSAIALKDFVTRQPTADVAEAVYGEWIHKGTSNGKKIFECSNCKSSIAGSGRFCKECGAKMDEKRAE